MVDQAQAVQGASKNDGPSQQSISAADLVFASKHTRAVVKAMKPRVANGLASSAPVNGVPPVISGSGVVGQTLVISNTGTWAGGGSRTYKWQRDSVDIGGATSTTYLLVAADSGHAIRAGVVQTNSNGAATAYSNSINVA